MGGDRVTPLSFTNEEEESSVDQDLSQSSPSLKSFYHPRDELSGKVEDGTVNEEHESEFEGFEEGGRKISPSSLEFEAKKRRSTYRKVLQSYDKLQVRSKSLKEAKSKILSYIPGGCIEKVGGMKLSDYDVPETTTLLLIGPKGSGKSSLVNRISNVFEDDMFAPERAQVSYNSSVGDGTYFLQEYMIPRGSTFFCLYDTRGLSDDSSDNIEMLKQWITKGVHHGKLVIRPSDSSSLRTRMKCKARDNYCESKMTRMVNFVIVVVDGLAVLKSMDSDVDEGKRYMQMIATTFNCPYLSFKDDKPVVVVTHGDLLTLAERARIRVHLGELLGIPPIKQIFDIPESYDPVTELTIVDMLRYSLEHADKNLPCKGWLAEKVRRISLSTVVYHLFIILVISIIAICIQRAHIHRAGRSKVHIDWHAIRHMWLE